MVKEKNNDNPLMEMKTIEQDGNLEHRNIVKTSPVEGTFPTGITMLNLALSNNPDAGFKGILHLYSQSGVGKTAAALNICGACKKSDRFKDYKIIYMDKEDSVSNFALETQFGIKEDDILILSSSKGNGNGILDSLERTYLYILDKLNSGEKIIAVIDSMDAYISESTRAVLKTNINTVTKGADNGKLGELKEDRLGQVASCNSRYLPLLKEALVRKGNQSALVLISQLRENIGAGLYESKTKVSGGKAVRFNVDTAISLTKGETLTAKAASGRELDIGFIVYYKIEKNRNSGLAEKIEVPFYRSTGMNDVKSLIDYLVQTNQIVDNRKRFTAEWLTGDDKARTEKDLRILIRDSPELYAKLKDKATQVWKEDLESVYVDY